MHYFNYKYEEVMKMDAPEYNFLVQCMVKAKANDDLEAIEVTTYPHLKSSQSRNKARMEILKRAETQEELEDSIVDAEDLAFFGVKVGNIADHLKE
jgi:hypothetical protein